MVSFVFHTHNLRMVAVNQCMVHLNRSPSKSMSCHHIYFPAEVETEIHGYLVVPAAGGMQALPRGADTLGQEGFH